MFREGRSRGNQYMWIIVQGFAAAFLTFFGLAFVEAPIWAWSLALVLAMASINLVFTVPLTFSVPIWLSILLFVTIFNAPTLRRRFFTHYMFRIFRKFMPPISHTEQEAIDAGDVWWEGQLFQGRPQWSTLLKFPKPSLSLEETEFLNNQVETLCSLLDEWVITHHTLDLPTKAWEYLKKEKFFGIIIPKEYGGLGFSALASSTIVQKICTRSLTAAVTTMVPNSLGPGELLLAYGTEEQKNYYLPKLASGEEIPCFALTGPEAGSDAGSIPDVGIVCKGKHNGKEVLGMRLTWDKRYITLAPVATVLGLAFKLQDPDGLLGNKTDLGITVCLLPTNHPGVEIGTRHFPLNQPFMNGPTRGHDVFVPLEWIIGGFAMAGKGWRMLVECLSAGRGISLPALSTAAGKHCYRVSGAYASLRKQFNTPIGRFEGVEEVLARIAGRTYALEATRLLTATAVDQGIRPTVASAIAKYYMTETARGCANDAMDVHGGRGIMLGPKNYLGRGYESMPISITVEGANILTRNLIIFGQGAIRCHPYLRKEMQTLNQPESEENLQQFDIHFTSHIKYSLANFARLLTHSLTGGLFCQAPDLKVNHKHRVLFRQITRMSIALSFVSDITLLMFGGKLKRKERLSARLGDVLSHLYVSSAVLKYYHDFGDKKHDLPHARWCVQMSLYRIQEAFSDFLKNFKYPWLSAMLNFLIFPYGLPYSKPRDSLEHYMVHAMMECSEFRDRITSHCYQGTLENSEVARLEATFLMLLQIEPALVKLESACKEGHFPKHIPFSLKLSMAEEAGILTASESQQIRHYEKQRSEIMQVDDFTQEALLGRGMPGKPMTSRDAFKEENCTTN